MSAEVEIPTVTAAVRKALCAAQKAVGNVDKGSEAEVKKDGKLLYKYAYTSSEDMLAHCREALLAQGLSWELTGWDVVAAMPGFNVPTLVGTFELCHGDSGQVLTRVYKMPIASRNDADKATAGAITYLLGQATRALLLVPKITDADSQNDPDKRTTEHGGWRDRDEPRSARTVAPAAPREPARSEVTKDDEKALDARLFAAVKAVTGYLPEQTVALLRKAAGVPAVPAKLTYDQKQIMLRSLQQKLKTLEDASPDDVDDLPYTPGGER